MKRFVILGAVLLSFITVTEAAVLRVPEDYDTIQEAIDDASSGDTVIVSPGLYHEDITFEGKAITLTSTDPNDPEVVANTIIEGLGEKSQASVVTFDQGESQDSVLTGFTIRGGYGTYYELEEWIPYYFGAGVVCIESSPTILRNLIVDNHNPLTVDWSNFGWGGGIYCHRSDAVIAYNTIARNVSYGGGGVCTYYGYPLIHDNLIYDNLALSGGGVNLRGGWLINNTIVSNGIAEGMPTEGYWGNLKLDYDEVLYPCVVRNNIICNAKAGGGIGMVWQGPLGDWFAFNDVWGNLPVDYQFPPPQMNMTGQYGNCSEDPLFEDSQAKDFHLSPLSPCINAGDPDFVALMAQTDMDGEPRISGPNVDIGADEYAGCGRPIASAGPNQRLYTPELIILDGSTSSFCDGSAAALFRWTQVKGPQVVLSDPCAIQPTFVPPVEGRYRFQLVVSDGLNESRPDEVIVWVGNTAPIANAGANRLCSVPSQVRLDGSDSTDPEDDLTYRWHQLTGPEVQLHDANTATPWFDCIKAGVYTFDLIVSDGRLESAPDTVQVTTMAMTLDQKSVVVSYYTSNCFWYPDVDGTKVVYGVGSEWDNFTWDIVCKDLLTGQVQTYRSVGSGQDLDTQPRIQGDTIVWCGGPVYGKPWTYEPSNQGILAAKLGSTRVYTLRPYSMTSSYGHPAVWGTKVVWLEHLNLDLGPDGHQANRWWNTPFSICGADIANLDKPVYFTVAQDVGSRDPYAYYAYDTDFDHVIDLWGNTIVWEADGDIFGADLSDLDHIRVFPICTHAGKQSDPAIYGGIVVWTDTRNDAGDIYSADISRPDAIVETALVKGPGSQVQPAIDGQILAYVDGGMYSAMIKACRMVPGYGLVDLPLQGSPQGVGPTVSGDTVIWLTDIYYGQVQSLSLRAAVAVANGPVENTITGDRYPCIQDAILTAEKGDRIEISPGTYYEDVDLRGKAVILTSRDPNDWDTVMATVIDGSAASLTCSNGETSSTVIQGLSLTGALNGVVCSGSTPLITRCSIADNSNSGVVLRNRSGLTLDRCLVTANGGAGIESISYIMPGRGSLIPNAPILTQCLIAGNRLQGITGDRPTMRSCTIVENGLEGISSAVFTMTNSIVYYNGPRTSWPSGASVSLTYSDVEGGPAGPGNLDVDPVFVARGRWVQRADLNQLGLPGDPNALWIKGDYPLTADSPVVDKGDPTTVTSSDETDLAGQPRVQGDRIDMGAFERKP